MRKKGDEKAIFYKGELYQKGVATVKKYTAHRYKITLHKCLRQAGFEKDRNYIPKGSVNDEKLDSNLARAKGIVYEYAICNDWQYFCSLTLDKKKYDRFDLRKYHKDLTQWLRDYRRKHKIKLSFILIPEHHKNGAWHIHGLINGLPEEHLTDFIKGQHPQNLIDAGYQNWKAYENKFGFVSMGRVKNKSAVSAYITKYIKKSMAKRSKELGAHLYYVSRGLKRAELIKKGTMCANIAPDYENDYVKIQWVHYRHMALAYFDH